MKARKESNHTFSERVNHHPITKDQDANWIYYSANSRLRTSTQLHPPTKSPTTHNRPRSKQRRPFYRTLPSKSAKQEPHQEPNHNLKSQSNSAHLLNRQPPPIGQEENRDNLSPKRHKTAKSNRHPINKVANWDPSTKPTELKMADVQRQTNSPNREPRRSRVANPPISPQYATSDPSLKPYQSKEIRPTKQPQGSGETPYSNSLRTTQEPGSQNPKKLKGSQQRAKPAITKQEQNKLESPRKPKIEAIENPSPPNHHQFWIAQNRSSYFTSCE